MLVINYSILQSLAGSSSGSRARGRFAFGEDAALLRQRRIRPRRRTLVSGFCASLSASGGRRVPSRGGQTPPAENPSSKMFLIYVLKSLWHGTLYIGSSENPEKRLENEHNKGKVRYTKGRIPWTLIYKEVYPSRGEVMKREKFLKSGVGRKWLHENLRT